MLSYLWCTANSLAGVTELSFAVKAFMTYGTVGGQNFPVKTMVRETQFYTSHDHKMIQKHTVSYSSVKLVCFISHKFTEI